MSISKWLPQVSLGVVVTAAGVGPAEAGSNISEWLVLFGFNSLPGWLVSKSADKWTIGTSLLLIICYSLVVWRKKASPLEIEFDGDSSVRCRTEPHPTFPSDLVKRKFYGICIFNSGEKDVQNVAVEVERMEQIPDRPGESNTVHPSYLGLKLKFKLNDQPTMTFSPNYEISSQSLAMQIVFY